MEFVKVAHGLRTFRHRLRFRARGRTYIVPSGFGVAFGILALIQLMMAIGSQNNLIYLFVFSEISIALSSMFFTNSNILRVQLKSLEVGSVFAGEASFVAIKLETKSRFSNSKNSPKTRSAIQSLEVGWIHFEPKSKAKLNSRTRFKNRFRKRTAEVFETQSPPNPFEFVLVWTPKKRGLQPFPNLRIQSSFPFGLLRAWKSLRAERQVLVFPQRKGTSTFPVSSFQLRSQENLGLFHDLRKFQVGDSPRRIDWRASSRTSQFLIRRFETEAANQLHFTWEQTQNLTDFEDRVSQLALWVDLAEREGSAYSLSVGKSEFERSSGAEHWQTCLGFLAQLESFD